MLFLVRISMSEHPSSATTAAHRNAKPIAKASHAFLSALAELPRLDDIKKIEKGGHLTDRL